MFLFYGVKERGGGLLVVVMPVGGEDAVYDLSGRKIINYQLPKGLYIQGNKKIFIK